MKLDDALADALAREGVDVLFTLVDDTILPLVQAAKERGIRIVTTRHEQAAVAMADGYARASHRLGVAAVGAGPGGGTDRHGSGDRLATRVAGRRARRTHAA